MLTHNQSRAIPIFAFVLFVLCVPALFAQTILTADGHTAAYTQFQNVLGVTPENPDCSHTSFGPHITQTTDSILGVPVFVFNIHVTPDNDRCINFDRQRLEAKTDTGSPDALKGFNGDTITYQWKFRLPSGFRSSSHFTHIHQIKGGLQPAASGAPVMTLTTRAGSPDQIQLIYQDGTVKTHADLSPFLNTWVVATETVKVSTSGTYSIVIKTLSGGQTLLSYSNSNINMFPTQTGTGFIRPKWGIYRSLLESSVLRDEQIHFNDFCVAKAPLACPGSQPAPNFSLSATPTSRTVTAGGSPTYAASITPSNGFNGTVTLGVSGLPSGASASFSPASVTGSGSSTLSVSTSSSTPAGTYTLTISGVSGSLNHGTPVTLVVSPTSVCTIIPADGAWHNTAFASHSGTFTASFDATPSVAKESAAVGLSHGAQTAYSGFANLVIFTTAGTIQARNGGSYTAASTILFSPNVSYHFRLAINVTGHTYSIFVTPAGGSEITVGSNFAFRTEQNTVTSLDHWGALVNTTPGGTLQVCNFAVQ
ncbi:MAG: hypothetical protein DMG67_16310 [Acidobacteria bacterium]|nr:MAG: hypothetical protein DMG67_16310 [Acidobacteriota bacterium]